ncbi:DNA-binding GntR family transcriptional regulator [Microbacterium sp. SLBN-154]|uniref:GntR family transcriptional regulator n=1 Tax=Microbacterium sp. SLBN-154 TaxID=2768458 RepID=UPI00114F882F|nr:GntR family transcriptional regulator [Microbacterium sp. SLBN-154]TQK17708.1 DNA-binding GntR family transcriptional regulator [Microbacterium sp. SLBN-154]
MTSGRHGESAISRDLLSDQVYDTLFSSIVDGSRAPGSRIVESEVARQLGVSQAPVREAVKRLAHVGVVQSIPRRGSYVTQVSPDEFAVARTMRASIEAEAARLAAHAISETELELLDHFVDRMSPALVRDDFAEFRFLDIRFHRTVVEASRRTVLTRLWETLEPLLISQRVIGDPTFSQHALPDPDLLAHRVQQIAELHRKLVTLLRSGQAAAAAAEFGRHARGEQV